LQGKNANQVLFKTNQMVWPQSNEPTMTIDSRIKVFFVVIFTFSKKGFLDEIFCNMLLKIHIIFSIHHIFNIIFSWITKNLLKMYRFYQIHFILKNYHNFKLYFICLFCCIINYNFALDVMYITPHLHTVKDSWKFLILFNGFSTFKNFKFHNFQSVFF